jgi:hypothetical protein
MKKILIMTMVVSIGLMLLASTSMATFINPVSWDGAGKELQAILDALVVAPSTPPLLNATGSPNDALANDSLWKIQSSGLAASTFIISISGNTSNEAVGIFDAANPAKKVQLFAGNSAPGAQVVVSIKPDGSVFINLVDTGVDFAKNLFGFYIVGADNPFYYSVDSLNNDGNDHMVAFQGNGKQIKLPGQSEGTFALDEYIFAFEDLDWNGPNDFTNSDRDYNDTVFLVESIEQGKIPEPISLILLGSGLAGAGLYRRLRKPKA